MRFARTSRKSGAVNPAAAFDPTFDLAMALMGFLGGMGTIAGPIVGAILLEPLRQYLAVTYPDLYLVLYGALFLLVLLLLPRGILPTIQERWSKYRARRQDKQRADGAVVAPLPEEGEPAIVKKEGINL